MTVYINGGGTVSSDMPQIGASQASDGKYYWTINGEWLTDNSGNKIPTTGTAGSGGTAGVTPKLKIENGDWYVSYDNGTSWEYAGKATGDSAQSGSGESLFKSVRYDDDYVYFTLQDGKEIKVKYVNDGSGNITNPNDNNEGNNAFNMVVDMGRYTLPEGTTRAICRLECPDSGNWIDCDLLTGDVTSSEGLDPTKANVVVFDILAEFYIEAKIILNGKVLKLEPYKSYVAPGWIQAAEENVTLRVGSDGVTAIMGSTVAGYEIWQGQFKFWVINDELNSIDDEVYNPIATNGALPGLFSVSDTKQVRFSQGNLQYQASTNTWRFAEHQWDKVGIGYGETDEDGYVGGTVKGSDNREISTIYSGWIDLFGWGTGNNPTKTSASSSDYFTFTDWGVNKIINGGNVAGKWFTLTGDEWYYLIEERKEANIKYGVGEVNGISGLILLPDNWTQPSGVTFKYGVANWGYEYYKTVNQYTFAQWQKMEAAGAVFFPAAGYRYGTSVGSVGSNGDYWSSTAHGNGESRHLYFFSGVVDMSYCYPLYGCSVRLVTEW